VRKESAKHVSGCIPTSSLTPSKTEFRIFSLTQLSKLNNPAIQLLNCVMLSPVDSARYLSVIFDINLSFAHNISAVSKSSFRNICHQRHIGNTIDRTILHAPLLLLSFTLKLTIVTIFYSIYLLYKRIVLLKLVLNSAAHAVTKTPKFQHITSILKSLH